MAGEFHTLRIVQKIEETGDSSSFHFELPQKLLSEYIFKAGQYLTLKLNINGSEERRAYSIYTAPDSKHIGVTVKRVKNGKVSNYLIDNCHEGDEIAVMTPEGKFVVNPEAAKQRDHYFFAGGSGITPIMSMICDILENEPKSSCYLLYANRNEESIIFRARLDDMKLRYEGQFYLDYILSQPHVEKAKGLSGLFGKKRTPSWRGLKGRVNPTILKKYMDDKPSKSGHNVYYLCGPEGMINTTQGFLLGQGIESVQIKKEFFTSAASSPTTAGASEGDNCKAEVKLNGETVTVEIPATKTILDALKDIGKDPPYSCTSGACSTCMAKVVEGRVEMDACFALDDDEIEDGYILACQARCKSATLKLDYDV